MSDRTPDLFILPVEYVTCCDSAAFGPLTRGPGHCGGQTRGMAPYVANDDGFTRAAIVREGPELHYYLDLPVWDLTPAFSTAPHPKDPVHLGPNCAKTTYGVSRRWSRPSLKWRSHGPPEY